MDRFDTPLRDRIRVKCIPSSGGTRVTSLLNTLSNTNAVSACRFFYGPEAVSS